jgi:hypothetical protein
MTDQEQKALRSYCAFLLKEYGFYFAPDNPFMPALKRQLTGKYIKESTRSRAKRDCSYVSLRSSSFGTAPLKSNFRI